MNYIIAVDAGGTKTEAIAYDREGRPLTTAHSGFGNPVVDQTRSLIHIKESIQSCLKELENANCKAIIAGVAGIEVGKNREYLLKELNSAFKKPIILLNDAEISYYSILQGQDGVLTIAGTGSISLGLCGGNKRLCGGWGHLLGDEGSAYDIAIHALKLSIHDYDTGKKPSPLTLALLNGMGIEKVPEIKRFIYGSPKGEVAAIASVIGQQGQHGNNQALYLLKQAGQRLAQQTDWLIQQLALKAPIKVGIKGSVLEKNPIVLKEFQETLEKKYSPIEFIINSNSAASGGFFYAISHGSF